MQSLVFSPFFTPKTLSLSDSLISHQMLLTDFIRTSDDKLCLVTKFYYACEADVHLWLKRDMYCQFLCRITENQSSNDFMYSFINILHFIFNFSEWTAKSAKGSNADKVVFRPHGVTRLSAHFSIIFLIRYYPLRHMFYTNVNLFHKISHWVKRFLTRKHN